MKKPHTPITRRDATGHMEPQYERELLAESRENRVDHGSVAAFVPRPSGGDEIGEELGVAFVQSATSGEEAEPERQDRVTPEETGGPFVVSNALTEFASGTDASNIKGATREPIPKTSNTDS